MISLRLDEETTQRLDRLAKARGVTRSDVIREAVAALAIDSSERERTPWEKIGHLAGIWKGGPPDLSLRTGERFAAMLLERQAEKQVLRSQYEAKTKKRRRRK